MCGIVGVYDRRGASRVDPERVRAMSNTMAHRGPDGEGLFAWPASAPQVALGMRRLAIIDLETGQQPIFNEDGTIAVVFNGEIYNYLELRAALVAKGHTLRSRSDTETLVHLYEEHGLELFCHLRGMYAFAIWDARAGRLVLAVDHVGIKPLYLTEHDGRLLFASEVKALLVDPSVPRRLNLDALDTYLSFGYMIGTDTLYDGIRRLPPGHALVAEGLRSRLVQHWIPRYAPVGPPVGVRAIAAEARERLAEAVRLHLRSDVPLGLFLSGGVDSAALLALMSRAAPGRVKTFSVGYDMGAGVRTPDDETVSARSIAAHFGSDHHEWVISADEWWRCLPAYVYHHDEPNANASAVSLFSLSRETAQHVKVALNGTGGDEVFCGYPSHRRIPWVIRTAARLDRIAPRSLRHRLIGRPWRHLEALYPRMRRIRYVGALPPYLGDLRALCLPFGEGLRRIAAFEGLTLSDALRTTLYSPALMDAWTRAQHKERVYVELLQRAGTDDPEDLAHALAIQTWLPGNGLLALDKVTMAHSLESRVPFFDPPLLEFAMRIPATTRLAGNKFILREAMRGHLPDSALRRSKQPFATPIRRWLDHDLRDRVRAVLLDERSLGRGLFRRAALESVLQAQFSGRAEHTELLLRLVLLELWQQSTIDAAPHVTTGSAGAVATHPA